MGGEQQGDEASELFAKVLVLASDFSPPPWERRGAVRRRFQDALLQVATILEEQAGRRGPPRSLARARAAFAEAPLGLRPVPWGAEIEEAAHVSGRLHMIASVEAAPGEACRAVIREIMPQADAATVEGVRQSLLEAIRNPTPLSPDHPMFYRLIEPLERDPDAIRTLSPEDRPRWAAALRAQALTLKRAFHRPRHERRRRFVTKLAALAVEYAGAPLDAECARIVAAVSSERLETAQVLRERHKRRRLISS